MTNETQTIIRAPYQGALENARTIADRLMLRTAAVIVVEPDGNSLRTIITGGKRIYTGIYQSRKTGRSNPWESPEVELPAMMEAEVRTDVKWWLAQPLRFEFWEGPKKLVYIPDQARRVLEGTTWRVVILECKRTKEEISRDPDYEHKLQIFKEICAQIRWRFEIVAEADLGTQTYRRNIETINLDRRTRVDARDVDTLRSLAFHGVFAYGAGCEALGGYVVGKKKLHALMVRRVAAVPLDRVICRDTSVAIVDRSSEPLGGDGLFD